MNDGGNFRAFAPGRVGPPPHVPENYLYVSCALHIWFRRKHIFVTSPTNGFAAVDFQHNSVVLS